MVMEDLLVFLANVLCMSYLAYFHIIVMSLLFLMYTEGEELNKAVTALIMFLSMKRDRLDRAERMSRLH